MMQACFKLTDCSTVGLKCRTVWPIDLPTSEIWGVSCCTSLFFSSMATFYPQVLAVCTYTLSICITIRPGIPYDCMVQTFELDLHLPVSMFSINKNTLDSVNISFEGYCNMGCSKRIPWTIATEWLQTKTEVVQEVQGF